MITTITFTGKQRNSIVKDITRFEANKKRTRQTSTRTARPQLILLAGNLLHLIIVLFLATRIRVISQFPGRWPVAQTGSVIPRTQLDPVWVSRAK
ncbi:hypothetical protein BCR44DRAFT_36973 [Catenaria anguillulae PL171]|uniref:Uncharacterized protein n=1 Tax=Catenaria anguillulae PL171 TaxID=765915 RepID=A0A1Y2HZW0_9FUNG|nr:hypothetical protein BCR44DRAFT_36973 [Catenaria anguillulae PL171]